MVVMSVGKDDANRSELFLYDGGRDEVALVRRIDDEALVCGFVYREVAVGVEVADD